MNPAFLRGSSVEYSLLKDAYIFGRIKPPPTANIEIPIKAKKSIDMGRTGRRATAKQF